MKDKLSVEEIERALIGSDPEIEALFHGDKTLPDS
jgi:hypothetical protein